MLTTGQMTQVVDEFLRAEYRKETYNVLARKYASERERAAPQPGISPFDHLTANLRRALRFRLALESRRRCIRNPNSDPRAVSDAGARGLMQIMPLTAMSLGLADPEHPEASIHAGIKYLHQLRDRFDASIPASDRQCVCARGV